MKVVSAVLLVCACWLGSAGMVEAQQQTVTIGVVTDGPYGRGAADRSAIRADVIELLSIDFQVNLPPDKQIEADWTLAGIQGAIDQLLADPEVDLLLTFGYVGSHSCRR